MDRLPRLVNAGRAVAFAAASALVLSWSCAPPGPSARYAPLAAGAEASQPALALRRGPVLARGVLGYSVAFLPDGGTVAVELAGAFELVHRSPDRNELQRVALGEAGYDVTALAVDTAGKRALVASGDGTVSEIDLAEGTLARRFYLGRPATAAAFVGERFVATGDDRGVLCLRRKNDGALLQCAVAHGARISALDATRGPKGQRRIASASWTGQVALWEAPSLRQLDQRALDGAATDLAFAPSGRQLAVALAAEPPVRSPEVAARERSRGYPAPDPLARAVVWNLDEGGSVRAPFGRDCSGHAGPVTAVTWTADGAGLLTGSWDRTVRLWSLAGRCVETARLSGFSGIVSGISASQDGREAAVATWVGALDEPAVALLELLYRR